MSQCCWTLFKEDPAHKLGVRDVFAVPVATGEYSHFLSPGSDNVCWMAPGELTSGFRISAVLLFALEFCGVWLSVQILRRLSLSVASA